jgi:osmotically-inducible protein OsmY
MEQKIKLLVMAALKRNEFTANQAIRVLVKGRTVMLRGTVEQEDLIYEAVATVESISSLLRVYSQIKVAERISKPSELAATASV